MQLLITYRGSDVLAIIESYREVENKNFQDFVSLISAYQQYNKRKTNRKIT